jgi:hypothetical protein
LDHGFYPSLTSSLSIGKTASGNESLSHGKCVIYQFYLSFKLYFNLAIE